MTSQIWVKRKLNEWKDLVQKKIPSFGNREKILKRPIFEADFFYKSAAAAARATFWSKNINPMVIFYRNFRAFELMHFAQEVNFF